MSETALQQALAEIPDLNRDRIIQKWGEKLGDAPIFRPNSREILMLSYAWTLQARESGDLPKPLKARLSRLAKAFEAGKPVGASRKGELLAGAQIIREWKGKRYVVTKTCDGFEYDGNTYKSLSAIARRITGVRWNGPAFFGLRPDRRPAVIERR